MKGRKNDWKDLAWIDDSSKRGPICSAA